ncbi:hypothetical protein FisN_14Lh076 [Fistulifera solaris]|uniref:C2H2-type domain-containing protein n=1 Tax=Fistulifera solaris TaxID=1519565 RepID=A0A1Z5J9B0_FISSO|nr:hypothetical protein FisN_14Lh076 [Fistulifera solaris]|eukprot:GAX10577.1 hypothetical protein FisN_14Lh076 [Fistulifera solaris]
MKRRQTATKEIDDSQNIIVVMYNTCDPWLSRAAREILHRHLSRHLTGSHDNQSTTIYDYISQVVSVGKIIEDINATQHCPLHDVDVLRRHEEQSRSISSRKLPSAYASSYLLKHNHYSKSGAPVSWYQCGLCQKQFLTRFYLDRHLKWTHREELLLPPETESRIICPAQQWCEFLVDCYDVAVDQEPYYSAGSGGWSDYHRHSVASLVRQRIPPCHEERLQQQLRACRSMVDACFLHDVGLQEYLLSHLCAPQTCQDRLHRIFVQSSQSSSFVFPWSSRNHWNQYRMFYCLLVALALLLGSIAVYGGVFRHRHDRPRSRLLHKARHQKNKTRTSFADKNKQI